MATVTNQRIHGTTHEQPIEQFAHEPLTPPGIRTPYRTSENASTPSPPYVGRNRDLAAGDQCSMLAGL